MADVLRDYSLPLLLALLLHALALVALNVGWNPARDEARAIKPQIVRSTLLVLEPKARPQPRPAAAPPKREQPAPEAKPAPQPQAQPEPRPDPEAERRKREREQAEAERRQRLEALAQSSFLDALAEEAGDLAESQAASEAEAVAQSYRFGIYQRVVSNWSRPPSARNRMEAKLMVELVPTGEVVAVTLLEGSGNDAFDRSAEAAIRKARRFEVPDDPEVFERYFRRFTLLFRPEDLLR